MHADRNGDIWGGMAGGVFRIRGDSVRFIDVVPGLQLSSIFHVIDDGIDSFWITSASGLYQMPFEELHASMDAGRFEVSSFRLYTRQDGLPSDAIRPNSRIWKNGSELWLPTEAGLFILNPQSLPPPLPTPVTLIDKVSHNDQQLPFLRAADQLSHTFEPGLRRLAVEFTSPYLGNSAMVHHKVRLLGFEDDWRIVTNRQAEFTNLPPGDYALQVVARIDGNPTEGAPAGFLFTVKPFIYQTTWFRVLVALCAVAALAFVIHSRTRSLRTRQQELQSLVEERTREIRANEALLSRNNELLRSLNEDKNEFLGIAAHDLRNPAAAIHSICDLLRHELEQRDCRDLDDLVDSIRVSSANMMELVSNLLDINKIEQGQMSAEIQPVRIPELIAEVISSHAGSIRSKEIHMRFERLSAANLVADADPVLLRQVIDNLITNAIKYSPPGSKVLVECGEAEPGWLRLSVKDHAGGIAEDEQQRLFTKFAKLSSQPTAGESSTGLGLSIAKRLTELMGGRIGCHSTLGKGSHFFVDLPRGSYSH
jgi:signal transduction histidine kinase